MAESQDSQLILDALRAELGVPSIASGRISPQLYFKASQTLTFSTTSGRCAFERSVTLPAQPPPKPLPPTKPSVYPNLMSSAPRDNGYETQLPDTLIPDPTSHGVEDATDNASLPRAALSLSLSNSTSQQTPTQANSSRDFEKQLHVPLSDSQEIAEHAHASNIEDRTLHEDDTGAVNLGNLVDFPRQSSQVSEDGGFENARGGWRLPDDTQKNDMCDETPYKDNTLPPETPALPKNPFALVAGSAAATATAAAGGARAPFGSTQLFGQTQLLTSAAKNSPTSSRPSPNGFNSILPGFPDTSPLKNRTNVSSPTDIRSSSPQRVHEVPATVIKGPRMNTMTAEMLPLVSKTSEDDRIPESPTRARTSQRQPLSHYEPMQQSQARKTNSEPVNITCSFDGQGHDAVEQLERQRRIQRKRAKAGQELEKITFERPALLRGRSAQNGKRRRLNGSPRTLARETEQILTDPVLPTAACAQPPTSLESTRATPEGDDEPTLSDAPTDTEDACPQPPLVADVVEYDRIPETSPVQLMPAGEANRAGTLADEPELPSLRRDPSEPSSNEPSCLPPWTKARLKYGRSARRHSTRKLVLDSSNPHTDSTGIEPEKPAASNKCRLLEEPVESTAQQTPTAIRSRATKHGSCTPIQLSGDEASTAASTISLLSQTPNPSSKTTPATKESLPSKSHDTEVEQVFTPSRNLRRRTIEKEALFPALSLSTRSLRASKRLNGEAQSCGQRRTSTEIQTGTASVRSTCHGIEPVYREQSQLFDGMVFVISVVSEKGKQQTRDKLESCIMQAGGTVLEDGFQELFGNSTVTATASAEGAAEEQTELLLSQRGMNSGFTAVIADGHSRKYKYMQALALGLPCLAHQWISACLKKGALVDWQPYLLCAGTSAILGDAPRSRCLLPYAADVAKLPDIIKQRHELLQGQSVLVVMGSKKSKNEAAGQPYLFLCHALGSRMTRVGTVGEARAALAEQVKKEKPFSWLYMDKSIGEPDAVLGTATTGGGRKRGRGRKKAATATAATAAVGADVRILRDELIIQSLILGRIVEPEEEVFC